MMLPHRTQFGLEPHRIGIVTDLLEFINANHDMNLLALSDFFWQLQQFFRWTLIGRELYLNGYFVCWIGRGVYAKTEAAEKGFGIVKPFIHFAGGLSQYSRSIAFTELILTTALLHIHVNNFKLIGFRQRFGFFHKRSLSPSARRDNKGVHTTPQIRDKFGGIVLPISEGLPANYSSKYKRSVHELYNI